MHVGHADSTKNWMVSIAWVVLSELLLQHLAYISHDAIRHTQSGPVMHVGHADSMKNLMVSISWMVLPGLLLQHLASIRCDAIRHA